ncbi:MAG TPA: FAD-binding protein [Trebonia sp.]|nr:FAD-binding protein [Trebonia sp.]
MTIRNWAGNITFTPSEPLRPTTLEEVRALAARSPKLHALGTGHSFNRVADSPGELITLTDMPPEIEIDSARRAVKVAAGVRYAELAATLDSRGFALGNLASLPHITVAGAVATGTHGSGDKNGSLATAVTGLDIVTAGGDLVAVPPDQLSGAVVALGALGVVTSLTLALIPAFTMRQWVYDDLPRAELVAHFDAITGSAYSVSAFTTWKDPGVIDMLWRKQTAGQEPGPAPATWHGARLADGPRHPVPGMPADFSTLQNGAEGRWHQRLPHFRPEFIPSVGEELQTEYLLPRADAAAALDALAGLAGRIAPLLMVSEIRTIAADDLWLSPCYGRDTVALHFTWRKDPAAVAALLPAIDAALAPFQPRPHWGKVFTMAPAAIRAAYPRLTDFEALTRGYDPAGKFRNEFLTAILEA